MKNLNILVCVAIQFGVGFANTRLTEAAGNCDNAELKSALKGSFFHRIGIGSPPADVNYQSGSKRSALPLLFKIYISVNGLNHHSSIE